MIYRRIGHKLKSKRGASLLAALLVMLICVTVASVVITAGTAAAGRIVTSAQTEQRYYAVNSAVGLLREIMDEREITISQTHTIQTVSFYTIKIGPDGNIYNVGTDTEPVYKDEFNPNATMTDAYLQRHAIEPAESVSGREREDVNMELISGMGFVTYTEYGLLKTEKNDAGTLVTDSITNFYSRSGDLMYESALDSVLGSGRTSIEITTFDNLQQFLEDVWNGQASADASSEGTAAVKTEFTMTVQLDGTGDVEVNTDTVDVVVSCTVKDGSAEFVVTSGNGNAKNNYSVKLVYNIAQSVNEENGGEDITGFDETQGDVQFIKTEEVSDANEGTIALQVYRSNFSRLVTEQRNTDITFELVSVENLVQP